jgi:RNA polymerase sigma-70 factor (ECF subfamily)
MILPLVNDVELVKRAGAKDEDAFVELVRRFERRVFRIAKQITLNDQDADDVLIETFIKAYSGLDECPMNEGFWVWLVSIAAKEAILKARNRSERLLAISNEVNPAASKCKDQFLEHYSHEQISSILEDAIRSLNPSYRAVFVLRDIEELSIEDTALALGLPTSVAKHRLLKARLWLGKRLTPHFNQRCAKGRP